MKKGAFTLAEGGSSRECELLLRLGVRYFFLSVGFNAEGVFYRAVKEVELFVVIFAVLNGAEESEFFGIFSNFADIFVFEQCFPHLCEFSTFSSLSCFGVVFGVREIEFCATFASEHAAVDVFEELFYCFFVTGPFVVSRMTLVDVALVSIAVTCLRVEGCQLPLIDIDLSLIYNLLNIVIFLSAALIITSTA